MLRVRFERYQAIHDGLRWRSLTMVIGGGLAAVVGTFGIVLGILLVVFPEGDAFAWRAGLVVGLFFGVFPSALGVTLLWRGVARRVHLARFRGLLALARTRPVFTASDLVGALEIGPREAELLVVDAIAQGLVFDDGGALHVSPPVPLMPAPGPSLALPQGASPLASPPPGSPPPGSPPPGSPPPGYSIASGFAPTQFGARSDSPPLGSLPPGAPASPPAPSPPARVLSATPAPGSPRGGSPPVASPETWIGTVLNDTYLVESMLGSGGMGAVYAARHRRTGRRYAIKTLLADARIVPDAIKRFEREATAASAIGHPNIIGVHDFHETPDGIHYMVMDLLEGETLESRLTKVGALPWEVAQARGMELASALAAAHARGLLHRDLKPANVFLARSLDGAGKNVDRAVLLDFGLVKQMDDVNVSRITVTGMAVGTPMYMPPEQARGEAVDVRSDVYGLAAVIYEMVTGIPPFFDRTLASVYAKLLTSQAPVASSLARQALPPAFDHLLACALAKTPGERFANMPAFARALGAITEDRLVPAG